MSAVSAPRRDAPCLCPHACTAVATALPENPPRDRASRHLTNRFNSHHPLRLHRSRHRYNGATFGKFFACSNSLRQYGHDFISFTHHRRILSLLCMQHFSPPLCLSGGEQLCMHSRGRWRWEREVTTLTVGTGSNVTPCGYVRTYRTYRFLPVARPRDNIHHAAGYGMLFKNPSHMPPRTLCSKPYCWESSRLARLSTFYIPSARSVAPRRPTEYLQT